MFGGKIFAEIKAVGGLLVGLKTDFADGKATALAAQASVPTSVPVVLPPAPPAAQAMHKEQASIVAGVDPMKGVRLPGQ